MPSRYLRNGLHGVAILILILLQRTIIFLNGEHFHKYSRPLDEGGFLFSELYYFLFVERDFN